MPSGNFYQGDVVGGKRHGTGTMKYKDGSVYEGYWKDNRKNGHGTLTLADGTIGYDGEWVNDKFHGEGTGKMAIGGEYEGGWQNGKFHGTGTCEYANGNIYVGGWKHGECHGQGKWTFSDGSVYEGDYVEGKQHGTGTYKWTDGDVYVGEFANDERNGSGVLTKPSGAKYAEKWEHDELLFSKRMVILTDGPPVGVRKLRSQRSQQQRLHRARMACEHCGVDDFHYKLRVCSGCNLVLYCSAACQEAANGAHRRICDLVSMLPSRDSDRIAIEYDREKMVDFDAGLRYATKYMGDLKHLEMNLEKMGTDDAVRLSTKHLLSLFRSKKGALESVFWRCNDYTPDGNHTEVWTELHGLKQLSLEYVRFDGAQPIFDIMNQQKDTLELLNLPFLDVGGWNRAKSRRSFALAVGACKHLVQLNVQGCLLMDSDLKLMLQDLPNLRVLNLARDGCHNHEFTDNTCGLIARKCPCLQKLILHNHNHLSARGIRKIFEGCVHLRSFYTTTRKLNCLDIRALLDIAPQLMHLSLADQSKPSAGELDGIIEARGGRTVVGLKGNLYEPQGDGVSAKTREEYARQKAVLCNIWEGMNDPAVANEWAGIF